MSEHVVTKSELQCKARLLCCENKVLKLESQLAAAVERAEEVTRERDAMLSLLHHIGGPEGFKGYLPCLPGHIAWEGMEYAPDTVYDWLNISLAMLEGGWND